MIQKPTYEEISLEEVDDLLEEACKNMREDENYAREIYPSGLHPEFRERVQKGIPQLRYWRRRAPASWLTEKEAGFEESMATGKPDDHPIWDIYDSIHDDPVKWIEWEFGVVCMYHQAEFLRSPAKRKVLRVSRRSGKTWELAMLMLWFIYVHDKSEVVLVCPSDEQVRQIFTIINNELLANHPEKWCLLREGGIIVSKRQHPAYVLEIQSIGGATCEINGRVCSDKIRGKGRENVLIVFDEFDFIENRQAINAVMNISMQNPRVGVVVASTPSGRRNMYYEYCTDRAQGWEEHQWTAWEANPQFTLEMAIDRSVSLPWNEYLHDVEADFGEEAFGWIRHVLIDEASEGELSDYFVNRGPLNIKSQIRTMGVDWDAMNGVGPSMVIVEHDPGIKKMKVIHVEVIPVDQFTLGNAVKRIIELNEKYNPHFIYCDRGYGERQVEELHQYGEAHPDSGLLDKVVGVSNSENVIVIDPATGEKNKKRIKQVMAQELRHWFEEHRIIMSAYDNLLRKQLENYRVVGYTQQGYKFNDDDEHLVDALMLAIHAISVNFDVLFNNICPPIIMSTGKGLADLYDSSGMISRPDNEWSGDAVITPVGNDIWPDGNFDGRYSSGHPDAMIARRQSGKPRGDEFGPKSGRGGWGR